MQTSKSWTTEFQRAYKNIHDLYRFLGWEINEDLSLVAETYPLFVPYRLAQKIKEQGPESVLAREFLPHPSELKEEGLLDPIGDKNFQRAPQLVHRYPSRVLFTPTSICPVHCRYCFRKNELNQKDELFEADFPKTLAYLNQHPEISEIIFTGGDPLTLSNEKLEHFL
jgi:lysine 2,3-aminomutase